MGIKEGSSLLSRLSPVLPSRLHLHGILHLGFLVPKLNSLLIIPKW